MDKIDFARGNGLIPAVIQCAGSGRVLMVGYMSAAALEQTCSQQRVWFYSRRRQRLWMKGESSGHLFRVKEMHLDCDGDALLVQVEPTGPACHTGCISCFFNPLPLNGGGQNEA